ncbi:MAG: hypothetical protein IKS83_05745, partial [Victivallales bacterium]|nr:hypothetical protein [Victivallales bacterium]
MGRIGANDYSVGIHRNASGESFFKNALFPERAPNGRVFVLTLPQGLSRPFRAQDSGGACPRRLRAFQALAGG